MATAIGDSEQRAALNGMHRRAICVGGLRAYGAKWQRLEV